MQTIVRGEGKTTGNGGVGKNDNGNGGGPGLPRTSSVVRSNSLRSSSPPKARKDYKPMLPVPEMGEGVGGETSPLPSPNNANYPAGQSVYGPSYLASQQQQQYPQGYFPHQHHAIPRDVRDGMGRPVHPQGILREGNYPMPQQQMPPHQQQGGPPAPNYPAPPPVHRNSQMMMKAVPMQPQPGHPMHPQGSMQQQQHGMHPSQGMHQPSVGPRPQGGVMHPGSTSPSPGYPMSNQHPGHGGMPGHIQIQTGNHYPSGPQNNHGPNQEYRPPLPPPYQHGGPPNGQNVNGHPGPQQPNTQPMKPPHLTLPPQHSAPHSNSSASSQSHSPLPRSPTTPQPPNTYRPPSQQFQHMTLNNGHQPQQSATAHPQQPTRYPQQPQSNPSGPPPGPLPPKISPQPPRPPSSNAVNNNSGADQNQNTLNNSKSVVVAKSTAAAAAAAFAAYMFASS